MVEIQCLSGAETRPFFPQMEEVYAAAFKAPPYNEALGDVLVFASRLPYHARWDGFRCVVAIDRSPRPPELALLEADALVGFAYGYTSQPDTWWRAQVIEKMDPAVADKWLKDCFEFVELAVAPAYQGKGTGGRLHDALLAGLRQRTAVLSTPQADTNAMHLYRKRGWMALLEHFVFEGIPLEYLIMGLRLSKP